jgi:hypothetical protein
MQAQQVRVNLFSLRDKMGHSGYARLTSEESNKVKETGIGRRTCEIRQCTGLESFNNERADQPDVRTCEADREEKLKLFKASSRPCRIKMPTHPAAHRDDGQPKGKRQSRVRSNHDHRYEPNDYEHRNRDPREGMADL